MTVPSSSDGGSIFSSASPEKKSGICIAILYLILSDTTMLRSQTPKSDTENQKVLFVTLCRNEVTSGQSVRRDQPRHRTIWGSLSGQSYFQTSPKIVKILDPFLSSRLEEKFMRGTLAITVATIAGQMATAIPQMFRISLWRFQFRVGRHVCRVPISQTHTINKGRGRGVASLACPPD